MAASVLDLGNPDTINEYESMASIKPSLLLKGDRPRLIDEWQVIPQIWDSVRTDIDSSQGKPGQFILTGSVVVDRRKISHSGTGRIASVHMLPMSLYESRESNGAISLKSLIEDHPDIDGIKSDLTVM